eukprot:GEMP01022283.1.p1 GENE.GEMP01022283.1~~GEMP01022283.1.p1  ORF type:complete len:661 (+),score=182.54 GEMP01022283.1:144-2126(+)
MWCMVSVVALAVVAGGFNLDDPANRPVSNVVNLLQDMQSQLEKEQETDQKVYDEIACWCVENDKEKSEAIENAERTIGQLTGKIESLTSKSARLNTEISSLNKEIAANTQSLDKATELHRKQLAEFNAEEKDLLQSITSLKSAVVVLSKHHPSMLQEGQLFGIASMLHTQLDSHAELLDTFVTPSQRRAIKAFIQNPSYASQSGEIFGILSNMLEEFQSNLSSSQKQNKADNEAFQQLKAAKTSEIQATQDQVDKMSGEKADANERLAQAKSDREDTRNSLSADEKFLMNLKEKCKLTDEEWEQRTKTRQEEILAVSRAIQILSGDDARDNFANTVNTEATSFLQVKNKHQEAAAHYLSEQAKILHNPHLAVVSERVRLDAFTKVKAAIDEMVAQLNAEKEDEVKHKDWCVEELNSNRNSIETRTRDRDDSQARIDNLNSQIKQLTERVNTLTKEISDLNREVKRGGEDRERANNEFQVVLQDQRETQRLLNQAKVVLARVYDRKTKGTSLLVQPKAPTNFKKYEQKAGGGVIDMLNQILQDSKNVEAEAIHDEEQAQKAYEQFIRDSNQSIRAKSDALIDSKEHRAKNEKEKSDEESNHDGLLTEIEQLTNSKVDIHSSCDFVTKNFDIRQKARDQEIEALRQAQTILSGSNFQKFLQA